MNKALTERRALRWRNRRIIYNDDAGVAWTETAKDGPHAILDARFNHCINSLVDSYFFCVGDGRDKPFGHDMPPWGDPHQLIIDASRSAGIEVFASLRMNDTHDASWQENPERFASYDLKVKRPDLLIGERREYPASGDPLNPQCHLGRIWSAFDYAKQEVHAHRLAFIKNMLSRYDWDGFEMDFCRFPAYFKMGEALDNVNTMTDFVRQVRDLLNQIGAERGRPYLLAARVADTPQLSRRLGLDVEAWMSQDLIDIVIAGAGFNPYAAPFGEFVELGHRFDVPVYPCIDAMYLTWFARRSGRESSRPVERLRAMASNMWLEGADGIYFFNLFVPIEAGPVLGKPAEIYRVLNEVGEFVELANLDKIYQAECLRSSTSIYLYPCSLPHQLPARLIDRRAIPLKIGDAVERHQKDGSLKELLLRIRVTDLDDEESIEAHVNAVMVDVRRSEKPSESVTHRGRSRAAEGTWFEGLVTAPPVHRGINTIEVAPSLGCLGKDATAIQDVQLRVCYE